MIIEIYDQALPDEIEAGMRWYDDAHNWATEISEKFGVSLEVVVAVTAALSPANKWERNVREAEEMIRVFSSGGDPATVTSCTYKKNKVRAIEALEAGMSILSGDKTTSFAKNILDPKDPDVVTIDRHAFNMTLGERAIKTNSGPKVTPKRYRETAAKFIAASEKIGIRPNQLQAITWLVWRRQIGVT